MDLTVKLEAYLHDTLDLEISIARWNGVSRLPMFLQQQYELYEAKVLTAPCLFMLDLGLEEETPGTIKKHITQVQKKYDGEVVYVRESVTSYNRKRLIEHKVPFIVPGNQLYLPPLGLDLREYFRAQKKETKQLSPASQTCVLLALLDAQSPGGLGTTWLTSVLAERLGYSKMTISRASKEIEALGLAVDFGKGIRTLPPEDRNLAIGWGKGLWDAAKPFFSSPVKKRHYVLTNKASIGVKAGISALAHHSMLAEPRSKVVAMSTAEWKRLISSNVATEINVPEPNAVEIEVWSYNPRLFATDGRVDRLSLYLSLKDDEDERVQMALDEMMDDYKW